MTTKQIRHYLQRADARRRLAEFAEACAAEGVRLDSNPTSEGATAFLARELEYVTAQTYDVLNFPIKARELFPFVDSVPQGAASYDYDQYTFYGEARFITDYANDFAHSDVSKKRFSFPMRDIGTSYHYTVEDVRAASYANNGHSLDTDRARAARMVIEQKIDDLIAKGDSARGLRGVAGETDFTAVTAAVGSWSTSTTAAQLFSDLNKLVQAPELASGGLFKPNRLVLPLAVKPLLQNPWSTSVAPITIEAAWLQTQKENGGVSRIDYWNKLDKANAGGTGGRALTFVADPMVVAFLLTTDYEEFPETGNPLLFKVKAKARVGGISVKYPLATGYMDIQ